MLNPQLFGDAADTKVSSNYNIGWAVLFVLVVFGVTDLLQT